MGGDVFKHIPEVLGTVIGDKLPERAAVDLLSRQLTIAEEYNGLVVAEPHKVLFGCLSVKHKLTPADKYPLVSFIIPTLGSGRLIQPCVNTLLQNTNYPNFEVIVVQNGSRDAPELGSALQDVRVRVINWKSESGQFNWSKLNNDAVRNEAKGDFLCFMNDDVCTVSLEGDWLELMVGRAQQHDVGVVGARLVHPMGVVQHIGVVVHCGVAGHMHKMLPNGHPGQGGLALLSHEASAMTGACMLVSRKIFDRVGGFDETFPINFNDTDFCMRVRELGFRNTIEMGAELTHAEGTTRDSPSTPAGMSQLQEDTIRFAKRWTQPDPYWSPNMALGFVPGSVMVHGLDCNQMNWEDQLPAPDADRVLIINDELGIKSYAFHEIQNGSVVYFADASGFNLQLVAPSPINIGIWDMRKPAEIVDILNIMGIRRIILRSLVGAAGAALPVECLRCLKALGILVELRPISSDVVTPWVDPDWVPGSEPFGFADLTAWKAAYLELIAEYPVPTENALELLA
jgi:GT2 family glycosyltransferase